MSDGEPALHGQQTQREDGQLAGEHCHETRHLTPTACVTMTEDEGNIYQYKTKVIYTQLHLWFFGRFIILVQKLGSQLKVILTKTGGIF